MSNKLTLKGVKKSQLVEYKNEELGIEFEFLITSELVDNITEAQEKQQAEMLKQLKVKIKTDKLAGGSDMDMKDIMEFGESLDFADLMNLSKVNPFEEVVFSIKELDKEVIKEHFEENFGGLASVKYSQFVDEMVGTLLEAISPDTPSGQGK